MMNATEFDPIRDRLRAAGFSQEEIVAGALLSEARAGLACLKAFGPRGMLMGAALSQTIGMMVGHLSSMAGLDSHRVVAVASIVAEHCNKLAEAEFEKHAKKSPAEQSAEILKGLMSAVQSRDTMLRAEGMDPSGPTDPSQIN